MDIIVNLERLSMEDVVASQELSEAARIEIFSMLAMDFNVLAASEGAYLYENWEPNRFLFGGTDREELIKRVKAWNGEIQQAFLRRLEAVCHIQKNGGLPDWKDVPMDTSETYSLSCCTRELDNLWFPYTEHWVNLEDAPACVLTEYQLNSILDAPEKYAIVQVTVKS